MTPGRVPLRERLDPTSTAIVVVDLQNDFVSEEGANGKWWARRARDAPGVALDGLVRLRTEVVPAIQRLVAAARATGALVVWARTENTDASNARYWLAEHQVLCQLGTWGADLLDGLAPRPGEPVVAKTRHSAFFATPLDTILRRNAIETVVVTGTATHGCVESTVRDAMALDYWAIVVGACCGQADQAAHELAIVRMDNLFALAAELDEVIAAFEPRRQDGG